MSPALNYRLLDSLAQTWIRKTTCGETVDAIICLPGSLSFITYLRLYK